MGITLKPVTLLVAVLAVAGAASGATMLVIRATTPACEVSAAGPPMAAPPTDPTEAERAEAMRRARATNGKAAVRGHGF